MQNVILVIHLLLALSLIGIVLMQRSEGGGLGIGGGTSVNTAVRSAASALAKVTWGLGTAFVITSLTLTFIAAQGVNNDSVLDRTLLEDLPIDGSAPLLPELGDDLLPDLELDTPALPPSPQ